MEKFYFDGNIPYEIFKTWNKCGDQIKTNYTILLTTENVNICLPYAQGRIYGRKQVGAQNQNRPNRDIKFPNSRNNW